MQPVIVKVVLRLMKDEFEHLVEGLRDLRDPGGQDLLGVVLPVELQGE